MQRSIFHPTGRVLKNNCSVQYDEYLDMSPFSHGLQSGFFYGTKDASEAMGWKGSTEFSMHESESSEDDTARYPYLYKLQAVVLHYGSHDSGHFVTLRRIASKSEQFADNWYGISDSSVILVENIQSEVYRYGQDYVYLLFYQRVKDITFKEAQKFIMK
jgi:ubiquitin C-terminal hydrolase